MMSFRSHATFQKFDAFQYNVFHAILATRAEKIFCMSFDL